MKVFLVIAVASMASAQIALQGRRIVVPNNLNNLNTLNVVNTGAYITQQQPRRIVVSNNLNNLNAVNTGAYIANQNYAPTPYEFAYSSDDVEGSHSAQQTGDGNGRVQGSYTITLADGRQRTVNYVADENGYRAEVTTNELGTESKNPADVIINSSAITGEQAAIQYGPQAPPQRQQQQIAISRPIAQINAGVALPSYGTFAGVSNVRG